MADEETKGQEQPLVAQSGEEIPTDWLTTKEAAEMLDLSRMRVLQLCREGRFDNLRAPNGYYFINPVDLEYTPQRRGRGSHRKCVLYLDAEGQQVIKEALDQNGLTESAEFQYAYVPKPKDAEAENDEAE